jgi:cobalt/nickel transport protein
MTTQVQQPKRFGIGVTILGILAIILLLVMPLILVKDSEFGGSDGVGSEAVASIAPEYNSEWTTNLWEPPGAETESMLFALQATAGGILIGYFFGYFRGRRVAALTALEESGNHS